MRPGAMRLAIIMPVLDEGAALGPALQRLAPFRARGSQVIVVDGGSRDDSFVQARLHADLVVAAPRGRGSQMNKGVAASEADAFIFLHADTVLPEAADRLVAEALTGHDWGRFDVSIKGRHPALSVIGWFMNARSRLTGIATGDQAMFMTRQAFEAVGGFPDIALMEDIAMSAKLKRGGPPACLVARVETSGRRWEKHGVARTVLRMWTLRARFHFGADPDDLARAYGYRPRAPDEASQSTPR
jgi:rSAM/selenodomain-associated transferase 2